MEITNRTSYARIFYVKNQRFFTEKSRWIFIIIEKSFSRVTFVKNKLSLRAVSQVLPITHVTDNYDGKNLILEKVLSPLALWKVYQKLSSQLYLMRLLFASPVFPFWRGSEWGNKNEFCFESQDECQILMNHGNKILEQISFLRWKKILKCSKILQQKIAHHNFSASPKNFWESCVKLCFISIISQVLVHI